MRLRPRLPERCTATARTGRYLLSGTWLYRSDMSDVGLTDGLVARSVAGSRRVVCGDCPQRVQRRQLHQQPACTGGSAGTAGTSRCPASAFRHAMCRRASRCWIVRFESVNYRATVWLNGHELGSHTGAYLPFEFDLPNRFLHPGGVNRLIVRVDDRRSPTDMPPGPGGLWFNFGGLQREVYLRAVQVADLAAGPGAAGAAPARPAPPGCRSRWWYATSRPSRQTVQAPRHLREGRASASAKPRSPRTERGPPEPPFASPNPSLWQPGHPYLYTARLTLLDARPRGRSAATSPTAVSAASRSAPTGGWRSTGGLSTFAAYSCTSSSSTLPAALSRRAAGAAR